MDIKDELSSKKLMLQPGALANKTVFITGGGTGLGRSMAIYASMLGANVIIASRRKEVCEASAAEIEEHTGNSVLGLQCDVRDYKSVEEVIKVGKEAFGQIDVLLNNAAGNFISPTERLSHKAFDVVVDIVLKGSYNCSLALGKDWIANGTKGNILSIVTTYAWTGSPFVVPSATAKAGVLSMTRSLAVEWAKYGIRCNAIAPGPFPTKGAWDRLFPPEIAAMVDPIKEIPLRRMGNHDELANLATYLMSDYSAYINGEVITIDGGEWLQDAGQFSQFSRLPNEVWDAIERKVRGKKS